MILLNVLLVDIIEQFLLLKTDNLDPHRMLCVSTVLCAALGDKPLRHTLRENLLNRLLYSSYAIIGVGMGTEELGGGVTFAGGSQNLHHSNKRTRVIT